jgi:hypothetical protein
VNEPIDIMRAAPWCQFHKRTEQVRATIEANGPELAEGIDVDAIAEEIRDTYGLIDINAIGSDEYWAIVRQHDATQA